MYVHDPARMLTYLIAVRLHESPPLQLTVVQLVPWLVTDTGQSSILLNTPMHTLSDANPPCAIGRRNCGIGQNGGTAL